MNSQSKDPDGSPRRAAIRPLLSQPAFRLLWTAAAASSFGDQFFAVALPWVVLQVSGSDATLGRLLTVAALPRASLMLVGGALSDRMPPARVLLLTSVARAFLLATVAVLVTAGLAELWQLYPIALVFGVLDALSGPAWIAIVPSIVGDDGLTTVNGVVQGTSRVSALIAPTPAGALISTAGLGAGFGVSAVANALAGAAFALMLRPIERAPARGSAHTHLSGPDSATPGHIMAVLRNCMRDPALRAFLLLIAALSFATSGPLAVGIPSLARVRFAGSVSLGFMLSASGAGTLVGAFLAGSRRRVRHRGVLLLAVNALIGVLLILLAYAPTVAAAGVVLALMACASTLVSVIATAALQAQTPHAILGRLMSIVMLASVGLSPASYFLAGLASAFDPALLFGAAGALVIVVTGVAGFSPALRRVD
ncbi:MAG: MFS transporter [Acidobacteriota bacterium]